MRRAFGLGTVVVVLAALGAPTALAQSKDDLARADALFNAGKALTDAGQYADACAKFAESKRLAPGLGVTLYLADCYEHVGRIASAWTEFRSAEGLARERNDKRADVARSRAQALESRLNRLTIAVAPSIARSTLQVLRDGLPVPEEELGSAVPVDAGDHVVVVSSPGHKMKTFDAHVGPESPSATVRIDSLDEPAAETPAPIPPPEPAASPAPAPARAAVPAAEPPTPTETVSTAQPPPPAPVPPTVPADPGIARRWTGLAVGGAGVIAMGVGTLFGLAAKSKLDQSNGGTPPPCDATDHCTGDGLGMRKDAEGAAAASTIAYVVGGLALAAGVALYVTAPRSHPASGVVIVPTKVSDGAGAMVRASF